MIKRSMLLTITKVAAAALLLIALSSCVIGGEATLHLVDKLVTTDVATTQTSAPVTATLEVRGFWRFAATAAYAVADGRIELCIVPSPNDPIEYCREAPTGHLPPDVTLLPGETLGKDIHMRVERKNRGDIPVETHTVKFTSSVPQDLILVTRFLDVDAAGNWTFDFEGRQATVSFLPSD